MVFDSACFVVAMSKPCLLGPVVSLVGVLKPIFQVGGHSSTTRLMSSFATIYGRDVQVLCLRLQTYMWCFVTWNAAILLYLLYTIGDNCGRELIAAAKLLWNRTQKTWLSSTRCASLQSHRWAKRAPSHISGVSLGRTDSSGASHTTSAIRRCSL